MITSESRYQVRLSELNTNQYSLELPLSSDTATLNHPFLITWLPMVRSFFLPEEPLAALKERKGREEREKGGERRQTTVLM